MNPPGVYWFGRGPVVPRGFVITDEARVANNWIVNELLGLEGCNFQIANNGYDTKNYAKVYGKGVCPIHNHQHHSNNWVVLQPHLREIKVRGELQARLPNAMITCYHKCHASCKHSRVNQGVIFLNGPILL